MLKFKVGVYKVPWNWQRHQIFLTPTLGIIDKTHYFGYMCFAISIAWIVWGIYIEIWRH